MNRFEEDSSRKSSRWFLCIGEKQAAALKTAVDLLILLGRDEDERAYGQVLLDDLNAPEPKQDQLYLVSGEEGIRAYTNSPDSTFLPVLFTNADYTEHRRVSVEHNLPVEREITLALCKLRHSRALVEAQKYTRAAAKQGDDFEPHDLGEKLLRVARELMEEGIGRTTLH